MRSVIYFLVSLNGAVAAFSGVASRMSQSRVSAQRSEAPAMIDMDLKGKVAFVAGVGDSTGYGWAICKALAEVGAATTLLLQQQQVLLHHPSPGRAPELPVLPPRLSVRRPARR